MTSRNLSAVTNGYLILANIFNTVKIENLTVPEVAQSGSDATLDCLYTVPDDQFTIMWLHNSNSSPVYKWSPYGEPEVAGVLEGRLDLSYRASQIPKYERRSLRIIQVDPSLSGEYTCVLSHYYIGSTRQTRTMLVYSPEQEFNLKINEIYPKVVEITCDARGLYPQPDMIIEYNNEPILQQSQRVWHHNNLYNAEGKAQLLLSTRKRYCKHYPLEVTCRLYLPQVDYTAMKKRYLPLGDNCSNNAPIWKPVALFTILTFNYFKLFLIGI